MSNKDTIGKVLSRNQGNDDDISNNIETIHHEVNLKGKNELSWNQFLEQSRR